VIVAPFPAPPRVVAAALDELRAYAVQKELPPHESAAAAQTAKPWDLASCTAELQRHLLGWLDDVVAWINEEHTWRTDEVVPHCWPEHPHLVHALGSLACLRWEAGMAVSPAPLDEWHCAVLPTFLTHVRERIGGTGCPPGRHLPKPGATRDEVYREPEAAAARRAEWRAGRAEVG
jgi:hypothetical protein